MPRVKQLTLSHENLPGMLASIAKVLGNEKVNILSCLTMTSGTTGTTHLVVDNVDKAKKALANARLRYSEADVLRVELPNTPWSAGEVRRQARRRRHQHHSWVSDERQGFKEGEHCASRFRFR
jgi:hypothetical protein